MIDVRHKGGRNRTHQVMHELGQSIAVGDYGSCNPFPIEAELCRRLSVSRSVLREAVKMLTGVEKKKNKKHSLNDRCELIYAYFCFFVTIISIQAHTCNKKKRRE